MFGSVKRCIGKFNQIAFELGIRVINSYPNANSEMLDRVRRAGKKFYLVHGAAQSLCHK